MLSARDPERVTREAIAGFALTQIAGTA